MITALGWACWNAPLSALLDQALFAEEATA
jgi:hypothetical protein